ERPCVDLQLPAADLRRPDRRRLGRGSRIRPRCNGRVRRGARGAGCPAKIKSQVTSPRATFLHYIGQHKLRIAVGVAIVGVAAFVAVLAPLLIGRIVDALTQGADLELVVRLAAVMVGLSAIESALRGFGRWRILDASRRIEYRMRNDLLAHLQTMHLAYFQHQRIGDLMARLTNDLQAVRQMIGFGILMLTNTLLTLLFTFISMFSVNVKLALITLALTPLCSYAFW